VEAVRRAVGEIAAEFAQQRGERQRRRELDPRDFERLAGAGFLRATLPVDQGGLWLDGPRSARRYCELMRLLGGADSSLALAASMHAATLNFAGWLGRADAPDPYREAWEAQRRWVFETVRQGHWWGPINSEPGSGGDLEKTKAVARKTGVPGQYRLSGVKHFGTGLGVVSFMVAAAVPEEEDEWDVFFMDLRDVPWNGSTGLTVVAPWDGHGMIASQSHAVRFDDFLVTRVAWPRADRRRAPTHGANDLGNGSTGLVTGIVETAMETAREQLRPKQDALRAFEQVEWSKAQVEAWLVRQAYEGMIAAIERQEHANGAALLAKRAVAELAESVLGRLCRVLGGGTYARHSPFGFWFEDVRALGFLRPPWALSFDEVFAASWREG
jgi:alkylation response protein AidB-like acyl-CoA dehydrogenase